MQYSEFEKRLIDMFWVKKKDLGAFRARLRHLRNLEIPKIPKRGKGNTVVYKTIDVLTAFTALALQGLGSSPAMSADLAGFAIAAFKKLNPPVAAGDEVLLIIANSPDYRGEGDALVEASDGEPGPFPGLPANVKARRMITNPLGGRTVAFIYEGSADVAGSWVAGFRSFGVSLINLTKHDKAIPRDE